jgi:hypothetical protein
MSKSVQYSQKPKSAAKLASEANRVSQMVINTQLGRTTPAPRERVVQSAAYEERFKSQSHRR